MKKIKREIEKIKNLFVSMRDFWRGDMAAVISFKCTKEKIHYRIDCKNIGLEKLGNLTLTAISKEFDL